MTKYDAVIIGGSTTGSFFAQRLAGQGLRVLVIEKNSRDNISPEYDIFHMGKAEMLRFGLPMPNKGDADYEFEFEDSDTRSAFGNYPKASKNHVVGLHKHLYILRMNDWAREAGAAIEYEASFKDLTIGDDGRICAVNYEKDGKTVSVSCSLAADCSGIPSVARRALPDNYGVEKFELTPNDVFFVTLRYIKFTDKRPKWLRSNGWMYYKTWLAPDGSDDGAILGVGANFGFDYAEKIFNLFTQNVNMPSFTVDKIEKGCTPYHRPPYSFVGDGFIAMGDAACLTKPFNGEGCTSSMVQAEIASEVIGSIIKAGKYPDRRALWDINKRYVEAQGKDFAGLLATLIGAVKHSPEANEFFFKHDIIFSNAVLGGVGGGIAFGLPDYLKIAAFVIVGIITGKVRVSDIKNIATGAINGGKVGALYAEYPDTPEGFEQWVKKADELWAKVGSMSDWKLFDL